MFLLVFIAVIVTKGQITHFQHQADVMGPSKPAVSDATLAFTTQLYRNEAKPLQTQLQFNRNVPAVPENLTLRFSSPRPIIIEKLKASNDQRNQPGSRDPSIKSSSMFSVISEERLKLAVQLAKRDIKRRHFEEQVKQQVFGDAVNKPVSAQKSQQQKTEVFEKKNALKSQTHLKYQQKLSQPSKVETTTSGAKVYLYTATEGKLIPAGSGSPPTCDTGPDPKPNANKKEDKNVREVQRLQKELRSYVQKIEELTKKGREREILDPDKEQQVCTRREKQAARSARMLYVLQQQVKEIQDDLEKLTPNKIKHTKKSRAVSRLAAAHRGAVRALQVFANQFMDQTEQQIPTHYKELGSLIRQLSLCSAKLEVDSSISDIIIDILLQVEDLDSLLEKKQTPKKVKKCISASQGKSRRNTEAFPTRKQLTSPKAENKALILKGRLGQECKKPPSARNLLTVQQANSCAHILHNKFQEEDDPPTPERNVALQGSMDALARAGAVRKDRIPESSPFKKKGMLLPAKSQGILKSLKSRQVQPQGKRARFQETTIAFQLKQNKRLQESRKPHVSPAPASLPAPPQRLAGLEAETSRGVKDLTDCSREEMKKMQKLRSRSASPTLRATGVETAGQECSEPPADRTQQVAANADTLSENVLDDLLEDAAQELWGMEQRERLQTQALPAADTHTLESMWQRMEEIERHQEAVRRRFTQIVYSDAECWAQEDKTEQQMALIAKKPTSPHPIQITKFNGCTESEMEILFEKLSDGKDIDENKEAEEKLQTGNDILQPLTWNSLHKECCVSLSVPKYMLQSILDYNSRYGHHLKLISHEAVGSFDPWQIAESLAEQLAEEALCAVAAELQDVCEDYAEAVFTSEFLQPAQTQRSFNVR
ncbi:PREDICTED: protein moonraker isoform X2 [Calidris pugnax]|uniref:protein moonraker isoform X2 n=1 Tax=Calidris pugnax TaxID=198806 RepID=UPI00071D33A9|nr:PREDICTED: protein moonraker isoform X2 [Calidris pugnax]